MLSIRKKFGFQLVYALSQVLFPLVTYPYITRTIGAEGLGQVGYIDYVSGFIITLSAIGIPFYGVREIARLQNRPQERRTIFRQLFSFHLLASLVGVLLFVVIVKTNRVQNIPPALLLLGCLNILLPPFVAEWYMQGMEAFRFTTIRSIVLRLLGLIAMLVFVSSADDYVLYFLIIVLVQAVVALTNLFKIGFKNVGLQVAGLAKQKKPLLHFFLTSSLISVYVFFDMLILGWFADDKALGFYALAIRLVKLSLLVVISLNVILFPRISSLLAANDHLRIHQLLKRSFEFTVLLTLPMCACFYFLAPQIVQLLAGEKFTAAVPLVQMLSALPLVIGLSNLFVYQVLIPFGKERKMLLAVAVTCFCSLLLRFVLANRYSERGTAAATMLTETCMTLLTAFFAYRTFPFSAPARAALQSFISLLPLVFFILFCQRQFTNAVVILFCSVIPGLLSYGLLQLFLFKNRVMQDTLKGIGWRRKLSITNG